MHRQRVARFEQLLRPKEGDSSTTSDLSAGGELAGTREELRELCLGGIPDHPPFLRSSAYRALLNLPAPSILLDQYTTFVDEISRRVAEAPPPTPDGRPSAQDRLLREIERDVERTFGGLAFFGGAPDAEDAKEEDPLWARIALLDAVDEAKARSLAESTDTPSSSAEPSLSLSRPRTRRQALLRPLFIYAMLNPGLSYVQGMNSLVAVFSWIFKAETTSAMEAEAKAFFALGAILSQLRDLYVPSLDASSSPRNSMSASATPSGLGATLARFTGLLTWLDPAVADRLESKEIDPALYCFRWITTLFANEFQLPDLVRVWDRIISLFPSEGEPAAGEALSPILGHLIDISLAMVLMERPTIVSPYSTFPRIIARLQDPQIDGEQVDKLLGIAWEIRERRLGKTKRVSAPEGVPNWRSAANKWAAAAQTAASNASASPAASSLRSRFWSTQSAPSRSPATAAAAEFELDETASQADSEASTAGNPLFASKGQRIGNIAEEVTTIDGKVLPPPPARIDEHVTLAELIEAEMPTEEDEDSYEYDDSEAPTLKERAANSWGGWKNSLSRLAASDAAAALSKKQTNLAIQAQILRDQLAEQAPDRIAKLKETVSGASGRLMASGHAERGPRRDGSPSETPFTPPRIGERRPTSPAPLTPEGAPLMEKSWSGGGPRPLLLSGSARRASNASNPETSPPGSRRTSGAWRSPSVSPTFVRPTLPSLNDLPVPIGSLGRSTSRGSHGRSASSVSPGSASAHSFHARSSSTAPSSATPYVSDDLPIHSLRLHSPAGSPVAETPAARLRRPIARHASSSESAVPAANGRGWTLSDAPIRPPALVESSAVVEPAFDPSSVSESQPAFSSPTPPPASDSPISTRDEASDAFQSAANSLPSSPPVEAEVELEQPTPHTNGVDDSIRNMFASTDDHEPVSDSVRNMFAHTDHSPETPIKSLPPRGSSLAESSSSTPPARQSSLGSQDLSISTSSLPASSPTIDEDTPLTAVATGEPVAPTRSKIVRRPGALKKRTSGRGSIGGSIDLSAADRRSVSEFLVGGAHSRGGSEDGEAMSRRSSARSKRMSVGSQFTSGRQSVVGWDEEDLLNAYGEEDGEEVLTK